jgi:flagellar motor switch protein FliM
MPSIVIKMMRQKFDQQWSVRKSHASEGEQAKFLCRLRNAAFQTEARLEGLQLSVRDLLALEEGNLVTFDRALHSPVELIVNGRSKYEGQVVAAGRKRGFLVNHRKEADQGTTSRELAASAGAPAAGE